MAENLYRSKVLIENWFEDRSDHTNQSHNFFKELRVENPISYTLTNVSQCLEYSNGRSNNSTRLTKTGLISKK